MGAVKRTHSASRRRQQENKAMRRWAQSNPEEFRDELQVALAEIFIEIIPPLVKVFTELAEAISEVMVSGAKLLAEELDKFNRNDLRIMIEEINAGNMEGIENED